MRKTLWGCAAAAVAALGAGFLAWDYGCDHPGSWLGRGVVHAEKAAETQVRTMEVGRRSVELAFTGMQGLLGQGTGAPCQEECKGPAEDAGRVEPAVLPGAVVMCGDDESEFPQEPLPKVHDLSVGGEECEPAQMPAVPEEAAKMPPCDDDGRRPQPTAKPKSPSGGAEGEPVFPKMDRDGGEAPAHPDVDTMEVRPGDLWFLDFSGPF
jgi:hypothetical protein